MSNFFEGLELFNQEPVIDFTPEYRIYYNKETGDITSIAATEYQVEPPEGDYIVLPLNEWTQINTNVHKIIDSKIRTPKAGTTYNLVKADSGYGTKEHNPYFVGDEDFYIYDRYR